MRSYTSRRTYDFNNIAVDGFDNDALTRIAGASNWIIFPLIFLFFGGWVFFSGFGFVVTMLIIFGAIKNSRISRIKNNAMRYFQLLKSRESWSLDEVAYYLRLPVSQVQGELQYLFDNDIIRLKPQTIKYAMPKAPRKDYDASKMYNNAQYTVNKVNENHKAKSSRKTYTPPQEQREPSMADDLAYASNELYKETIDYITLIRKANEKIPGEAMSEKIDKLEKVTMNIYKATVENKELLKKTKRFMSYYLPTTQKLIEKYAELDSRSIQTENTAQIKAKIEESLDTITKAFYELYNSLYDYDAIDITSEIDAFKNALANDGLIDNGMDIHAQMEEEKQKVN